MAPTPQLDSLSNDQLLVAVRRLTAHSNVTLAALLAHLGEVEARGIHRECACASLYTYLQYELRMSEDAAYRRAKAARLVRHHPEVYDAIAKGQLHLTGLLLIGPYLGTERHQEVLLRARHRSKREILRLIAEIDPKPEVPARIEPLGPGPVRAPTYAQFVESLAGPVRALQAGERPEDWIELGDDSEAAEGAVGADADNPLASGAESTGTVTAAAAADTNAGADADNPLLASHRELTGTAAAGAAIAASTGRAGTNVSHAGAPTRPLRYKVQFTADQVYADLVGEAFDLLGHGHRQSALPDLHVRALRLLVEQLRRQKRAAKRNGSTASAPEQERTEDGTASVPTPGAAPAQKTAAGKLASAPPPEAAPARKTAAGDQECASQLGVAPARKTAAGRPASALQPRAAPERNQARRPEQELEKTSPLGRRSANPRHVPAAVRRAVAARDAERCAYVDKRGERCRETRCLEFHHREPHARGGPATVDNLELRCRAHNALAAEHDFGREHMARARPAARPV